MGDVPATTLRVTYHMKHTDLLILDSQNHVGPMY